MGLQVRWCSSPLQVRAAGYAPEAFLAKAPTPPEAWQVRQAELELRQIGAAWREESRKRRNQKLEKKKSKRISKKDDFPTSSRCMAVDNPTRCPINILLTILWTVDVLDGSEHQFSFGSLLRSPGPFFARP